MCKMYDGARHPLATLFLRLGDSANHCRARDTVQKA